MMQRAAAGLTALVIVVSGCTPSPTSAPTASGQATASADLVFGAILSTSGIYAAQGGPAANALDVFEKTAPPVKGRKIHFIVENDQSDPAQSAAAARTLIENKDVLAVAGPTVTAPMLGAFPIVQPAKTPFTFITPNPYPNYNQEPYVFGPNLGAVPEQGEAFIRFFKSQGVEADQFAVLANDDASGQANRGLLESKGIKNVVLAPATITDYTPILRQMQSQGIKGLVNIQSGTNAGYTRKSQIAMGFDVPLILAPNAFTPSFTEIAGTSSDGVYVLAVGAQLDPTQIPDKALADVVADFQKRLKDVSGKDAVGEGASASMAWDVALSYYYAVENAKSLDRAGLQEWLNTASYVGVDGVVKRSSTDHSGFQVDSFFTAILKDGKPTIQKPG